MDILIEDTSMPSSSTHRYKYKPRGAKDADKKQKAPNPSFRKAFRGTLLEDSKNPEGDEKKHDEKLTLELSECLEECSQQRLRALHMSLRLYGNDEAKISNKELIQSFHENGITIPSRLLRSLTAKSESPQGVDLEGVHRFVSDAHDKTGRDSVMARHQRNDLRTRAEAPQEEVDEDLLWRIESELIRGRGNIDVPSLKAEFQNRDLANAARLDFNMMKQICTDQGMPIYGALLKNLLKRCAERKNNERVKWPEFLSFLEKAQNNAWVSCPSLKDAPQQIKVKVPVAPSPIDELPARARNTLVNKIRKKSSLRSELSEKESKHAETDENQNKTEGADNTENNDGKDQTGIVVKLEVPESVVADKGTITDKKHTEDTDLKHQPSDANRVNLTANSVGENSIPDDKVERDKTVDKESKQDDGEKVKNTDNDANTADDKFEGNTNQDVTKENPVPMVPVVITIEQPPKDGSPTQLEDDNVVNPDVDAGTYDTAKVTPETVKTEEEVEKKMQTAPEDAEKKVKYEVNVRGKSLQFDVDKSFLDNQTTEPPAERLRPEWVYGYRGNDCRKNIHVLGTREIVYFISYIAVVLDRHTNKQRHYREHTDDIKCIDVHSDKTIVATGQYASRRNNMIQAHIRVWRSDNLHTLRVLGMGKFEKCVVCVTFSPEQDILVAVDNSLEKKLTVWNTVTGKLKGEELLNSDLICDAGFNPKYPDTLVTVGKEHLCWWKVYPDSNLVQAWEKPDYGGFLRAKFVICLSFTEHGDLITGDSNGTIYIWGHGGHKVTNYVKHAHDGPVFTVLAYKGQILSGGRDGLIHCWQCNKNMDSAGFVQLPKTDGGIRMLRVSEWKLMVGTTMNSILSLPKTDGGIRMLRVSEWKLMVGTTMNSILAVNLAEGDAPLKEARVDTTPVTQCHYDELRGLTTLRNSHNDVITAGLDGIVCGFNTGSRRSVFKFQIKGNQYLCVDVDESGTIMALGTKDGHLQLMELNKFGAWEEIVNRKLCRDRIVCVRLSPDCTSVAVGSHDSFIHMFWRMQTDDHTTVWEYAGKLKGHVGAIHSMDWSTKKVDVDYLLRSCSSHLELKYWQPSTLESYDKPLTLTPRDWVSHTALVDLLTVGALATKGSADTEVMCTCINTELTLVATGDNHANVHLYRAPCSLNGVLCHSYKSHATVHSVRFTPCGKRLMTVGGRDSCIMQWEIV